MAGGRGAADTEKKRIPRHRVPKRSRLSWLPHTLTFELVDEGGHSLFLVFGTGSLDGVER